MMGMAQAQAGDDPTMFLSNAYQTFYQRDTQMFTHRVLLARESP
uniref:Uncharacterized protein n=1 Tax=mine drainage metagenome TaxID=410659 RepID=E6QH29_9ZZZZ